MTAKPVKTNYKKTPPRRVRLSPVSIVEPTNQVTKNDSPNTTQNSTGIDYSEVPVETIPQPAKSPLTDVPDYIVAVDHEELARECRIAQFPAPPSGDSPKYPTTSSVLEELEPLELIFDNKENEPPFEKHAEEKKPARVIPSAREPKIVKNPSHRSPLPAYMRPTQATEAKRVTPATQSRRRNKNVSIAKSLANIRAKSALDESSSKGRKSNDTPKPSIKSIENPSSPRSPHHPANESAMKSPVTPLVKKSRATPEKTGPDDGILDILDDPSLTADLDY